MEGYLGDLEGVRIDSTIIVQHLELLRRYKFSLLKVMEDTQKLQSGVETLDHQYSVLRKAMKESLNIKLAHDKGR